MNVELNQESIVSLNLNSRIIALDNIFLSNNIEFTQKLDFLFKFLSVEEHPHLIFRLNRMITNLKTKQQTSETNILIGKKEKKGKQNNNEILKSSNNRNQKNSILTETSDADLIETYLDKEDDVFVIATMVKAIGTLGGLKYKDTIIKYLDHPDSKIRASAAESLMLTREKCVYNGATPHLNSEHNRIIDNEIKCFDSFGFLNELSAIEKMVRYGDENHLKSAIWVLNRLSPTDISKKLLAKAKKKLNKIDNVVELYTVNNNTCSNSNQNSVVEKPLLNLSTFKNIIFLFVALILTIAIIFPVLINTGQFNKKLLIIRQVKKISNSNGIEAFDHTLKNGGKVFISEQEILKKYPQFQIWEKNNNTADLKFIGSTIISILNNNGWEYNSMIDSNTFVFLK